MCGVLIKSVCFFVLSQTPEDGIRTKEVIKRRICFDIFFMNQS